MRVYSLNDTLPLGYAGENEAREIAIDICQLMRTWPDLRPELVARRPGETDVYPCKTRVEDGVLIWTVTGADTAKSGEGEARVYMLDGEGKIAKSRIVKTLIRGGMEGEMREEMPDAAAPWVESVTQAGAEAKASAEEAKAAADSVPEAIEAALAEAKASGEFDGPQGEKGDKGDTGYTPVKGVDYFDGKDGPIGPAGADGFNPEVRLERTENGVKITAVNHDGEESKTVYDGADGQPADVFVVLNNVGEGLSATPEEIDAAVADGKAIFLERDGVTYSYLGKVNSTIDSSVRVHAFYGAFERRDRRDFQQQVQYKPNGTETLVRSLPILTPNPYKLKLTGAVEAEYDGTKAITVNIPEGGTGGGSGADGEDGGYYRPSVDANGVLSWTASKADMPSVSSANIKGPIGPQGAPGSDGADGFSPTVTLTREADGVVITATNKDGETSEKVYDGKDAVVDETLSQAGQAADAKATGDALSSLSEEIAELKGTTETVTKTGTVVSFGATEGDEIKVESDVTSEVTLVHHGKNFMPGVIKPSDERNGISYTTLDDGRVKVVGTATATTFLDISYKSNPIYLPAGSYTASVLGDGGVTVRLVISDVDKSTTIVSVDALTATKAFTLSEGARYQAYIQINKDAALDTIVSVQVERGGEATDFVKCTRNATSVALPTMLTAMPGENIIYTEGGDMLTVSMEVYKGSGIDNKVMNALIAEALKFDPAPYGLPVLHLTGDTTGMSKDDAVTLDFAYGDRSGTCTVKWQGSSSLTYPKKNYTVKFDTAFEAADGWGEQKKYCLKANFIDFSHSRNVCGAKLWGQVVASRNPANETLAACPNYGAVDGFPIVIMINNEYMGVYCFNIPKDGWMLNMGEGDNEAILCADLNSDANLFKTEAVVGGDKTDFELEYVSDEDNSAWVQTSLNNLIRACINSDGTDLDTTIADMLDWDSAIDYFIFSALIDNRDGISKNYLLHTWDGTKWYFDAYDMDSIFGLYWNGKNFLTANAGCTFGYLRGRHRVCELICTYKLDALKARYKQLRVGALSEDNVALTLRNFAGQISRPLLDEDNRLWPTIPNTSVNTVQQAIDWYRLRIAKLDAEIEAMQ